MRRFCGVGVSPGIVLGHLKVIDRSRLAVDEYSLEAGGAEAEVFRLKDAITKSCEELESFKARLAEQIGAEHLILIDTHLLILSDERLFIETSAIIEADLINAEGALSRTLARYREFFSVIEDDYLRERISDVEAVIEKVIRNMAGRPHPPISHHEGQTIVVAQDLTPGDILQMDRTRIIGIATEMGGRTTHAAILARAFEMTAAVALNGIADPSLDGLPAILDGLTGTLVVNPNNEVFRDYLLRKQHHEYVELELLKIATLPAVTLDGHRLLLKGNVEISEEGESLLRHGAEGVGLYRTEMLFMNRLDMPGEEEQFEAYRAMQKAIAPYPLTIRTLDAGGDKIMDGMRRTNEQNPALGVRAIRLTLGMPDEFRKQLRAILRASAFGKISIMFPMISGLEELRRARAILDEARKELDDSGILFDRAIPVGIMMEVPSAVTIADLLALEADFFSVGTNDLIQYSLAIDRSNEHLASLYQPLHPAVLRSLRRVVEAAESAGIPACICGEMAGDPQYLPVLLGLGFKELSMSAASIPRVKQMLRRCSRREAEEIAQGCFDFATAAEVDIFLKSAITKHFAGSCD